MSVPSAGSAAPSRLMRWVLAGALMLSGGCTTAVLGSASVGLPAPTSNLAGPSSSPAGPVSTVTAPTGPATNPPIGSPAISPSAPSFPSGGAEVGAGPAVTITLSDTDGTVTTSVGAPKLSVDIYAEPICPPCAAFEQDYGPQLQQAVQQGKLQVRLHLMNFLDASSASGDYSSRAANSLFCMAYYDPAGFFQFQTILFSKAAQPRENATSDIADDGLVTLALTSGGSSNGQDKCITDHRYLDLADASNSAATDALNKITGKATTPTVLSRGVVVDLTSQGWLEDLLGT